MRDEIYGEYVCDREQCGYVGAPKESDRAEKVAKTTCGLLACGPLAAIILGLILGVLLSLIHSALVWVGFILGAALAVLMIIGEATRSSCPACERGHLESVDTERGRALLSRARMKYGRD